MKKIITGITLLTSIAFFGQNTFPTTGNVGIGTSNPQSKLHVGGAGQQVIIGDGNSISMPALKLWGGHSTGFAYLQAGGSAPAKLRITKYQTENGNLENLEIYSNESYFSGKVGVGTSNPQAKLHVGGAGEQVIIGDDNSISMPALKFWGGHSTGFAYLQAGGSAPAKLRITKYQTTNGDLENLEIYSNKSYFSGKVGIGTSNPDSELTVKGKIHCEEVKVDLAVPADYVFEKYYTGTSTLKEAYTMPTLEEVETYTKENHHLPSIPSAKTIQEEGLHLKEMTNLLLQKIEELTLYTIEQNKAIKILKQEVKELKKL